MPLPRLPALCAREQRRTEPACRSYTGSGRAAAPRHGSLCGTPNSTFVMRALEWHCCLASHLCRGGTNARPGSRANEEIDHARHYNDDVAAAEGETPCPRCTGLERRVTEKAVARRPGPSGCHLGKRRWQHGDSASAKRADRALTAESAALRWRSTKHAGNCHRAIRSGLRTHCRVRPRRTHASIRSIGRATRTTSSRRTLLSRPNLCRSSGFSIAGVVSATSNTSTAALCANGLPPSDSRANSRAPLADVARQTRRAIEYNCARKAAQRHR
jgi:hypothetical protein